MIADCDKIVIQDLARKYRVKSVMLFGSNTGDSAEPRDIDLAVSGIAPGDFFRFYSDLLCSVTKPVDLVDLDKVSLFTRLIHMDGITLYEQAA
jgi:predicted nucleotidyltransferase